MNRTQSATGFGLTIAFAILNLAGCVAQEPVVSELRTSNTMDAPASPNNQDSTSEGALRIAEAFIDAFYSWDRERLSATMDAPEDAARTLYYQGWAEAGQYQIQTRRPCQPGDDGRIECSITVTDDIGAALGYVATDVFHLRVENGRIVGVEFDSDDPPILDAVFEWMAKDRPEVFAGPCKDLFAGGKTPAACVRAVVQAARDFVEQSANP